MIESHARSITYRGHPAQLTVIRNDGYCWGRLVTHTGIELDVATRADHYEACDTDALDAFERASRNPRCVSEAMGWLGGRPAVEPESL